ncbi:MAG: hypothetical protein KDD89_09940, partial [Anaerolineales bacterium]|nr:hypothetical protein [Anaerolineales bacterium]
AMALYAFTFGQLLATVLLGWLTFYLFTRLPLAWTRRARAWLWRKTIGRDQPRTAEELQVEWVTAVRAAIQQQATATRETGDRS